MASLAELATANTPLSNAAISHLQRLVGSWALPCDLHLCADTCLLHASSAAPPCARSLLTTHVPYHQVRTLVIGPVGSVVELQFREVPKRTECGAYRVRLIRMAAELGGTTQMSRGCSHPVALQHTDPPLPPPSLWPWRGKMQSALLGRAAGP